MPAYPDEIYDPRAKENKQGVIYDPDLKTRLFVEDLDGSDGEIIAIETELGITPKGIYASVAAFLQALKKAVGIHSFYGINVQTLSADKTLTAGSNKIYQYLDPDGTARIITLATENAVAGDIFVIKHIGSTPNRVLYIKQATTVIGELSKGSIKHYIFDGTNWTGISIGSGKDFKNILIGYRAFGAGGNEIVIGFQAQATDSSGISIGYSSNTGLQGTAVGYNSDAGYYSTAIGYNADTNDKYYSIALGNWSKCYRYSELSINITNDSDQENNVVICGFVIDTSNNTPTEMFCGGVNNERFTIRPNSILSFRLQVCGRDNVTGDCAVYHFKGAMKRDGAGNTALVGAIVRDIIGEDDASWDCNVTVDDVNDSLKIEVTGDATNAVQWTARLDGVETHF